LARVRVREGVTKGELTMSETNTSQQTATPGRRALVRMDALRRDGCVAIRCRAFATEGNR
jgi:hypothetical protein